MSEVRGAQRTGFRGRIIRIVEHAPDLRALFLSVEGERLPRYQPGMFISIAMALGDEVRSRPYTIASSCEDGEPLEILFNLVEGGRGSHWLFERKAGDTIDFTGPYGLFVLDQAPAGEAIFIAEGTAIAPIRPMLRRLLPHAAPVHLLYGATRTEHFIYQDEFERLQKQHSGFKFERFLESAKATLYGRLRDEIERRWICADQDRARQFFICGVGPEVIRLRDALRAAGYERRSVRYEKW